MPSLRQSPAVLLIAVALVAGACSGSEIGTDVDPIVIGSFDSAESEVIAEVYRLALAEEAFPVVHRTRIGDRADVVDLLRGGTIDLVFDYLGTSLDTTFGIEPDPDVATSYRSLADAWFAEGFLAMLPAPAQRQFALAMRTDAANALGVTSVTDLVEVGDELVFGGPTSCVQAPWCLPAGYDLEFGRSVATEAAATVAALLDGEIDVGLVVTSDPAVEDADLLILMDDRGLLPPQSIVPIVSVQTSTRFGDDMLAVIDAVSAVLEQRAVVQLNRLVASGRDPAAAATEWLLANDFIGTLE